MTALPLAPHPSAPSPDPRGSVLRLAPSPGQTLIASASAAAWRARTDSRITRIRQVRARARIAAIDAMLDALEMRHLKGERTFDRLTRARLRRLEEQVGLPLPRKAARARNTVRLHSVLLDWQEQVLDEVAPYRRQFSDVTDADWNSPTPDYSTAS